jgi:cytochrome c-type biogenesis protein CcmH/NrfF
MLVLMLAIAFRANRYWPMGLAAMQMLQVFGHLIKLADPTMLHVVYWISAVVWAYPMLLLLLLGAVRHRNRVKRTGPEPSWSNSSPR